MDFPIIMTTPTMEDIPPWPAPQASDLSIAACPPLTTNQPTLNAQPRSQQSDNIGIFEGMANSKDERYNPYMLPDEAVFQIHVVSEIMYDGRVQNMEEISLSRQATWKEAQPSLITAATSWQSEPWGCGSRDGKWLYQLTHNGLAEKQSRPLESVTNWKALKWFMLEGNAECERTGEAKAQVIVWHEAIYAEMCRRKEWKEAADKEDLVDFHNVCEMDVELSLGPVDLADESGIEKRRRLSRDE